MGRAVFYSDVQSQWGGLYSTLMCSPHSQLWPWRECSLSVRRLYSTLTRSGQSALTIKRAESHSTLTRSGQSALTIKRAESHSTRRKWPVGI